MVEDVTLLDQLESVNPKRPRKLKKLVDLELQMREQKPASTRSREGFLAMEHIYF